MAYVVQRDDRFYAVVYDGIDPLTGRERRRWHPAGASRLDAEALAANLEHEAGNAGTDARSSGSVTLRRFLVDDWLPAKRLALRPTTWGRYAWMTNHYVTPALGEVPLRRLRAEHLEGLYRELLERGRARGGGLSPKTVVEVHSMIRSALRSAVRKRYLRVNVADNAVAPRVRSISRSVMRSWTAEQLRAFLTVARSHRLFPALYLAATTGMRRGEVCGLLWSDVDLSAERLSVNRALHLASGQLVEVPVKTRTSRRSIDLDAHTVEILRVWQEEQQRAGHSKQVDGPVFTAVSGKRLNPDTLTQTFDRLSDGSSAPRIRLHDLRHTHATLLIAAGIPVKVVSERLGHASPAFTMVTYQHVLPGMQAQAAATFAELITM